MAWVTGGSRGIGAATARALAEAGADVALSCVSLADKAAAVVAELKRHGVRAAALPADQAVPALVLQRLNNLATISPEKLTQVRENNP